MGAVLHFVCSFVRYVPSQADVAVYNEVGTAPGSKFVNALRWFNHISSYDDDEKLVYVDYLTLFHQAIINNNYDIV